MNFRLGIVGRKRLGGQRLMVMLVSSMMWRILDWCRDGIDEILRTDKALIKKQRHTGFLNPSASLTRLRDEHGYAGNSLTTV